MHEQERDATPNLPLMETQTTPGDVPLPETEPDTPNLPLIETQTTAETEPSENSPINHKFYVYVSKKRMKQLESEAKIGRLLLLKTKQKKYIASPHAKSLMAVMMAHVPKISLDALQCVISFSTACLLHDLGLPVSSVPQWCPSASTLKDLLINEARNTIVLERETFKNNSVSLMCDKGDGSKQCDGATFVKLLIS